MNRKSNTTHFLEYALLRAICLPLQWLPYGAALCLAWVVAHLALVFRPKYYREACRRIRTVLGEERKMKDVRRIARISWRNIVFCGVELVRSPRMRRKWVMRVTDHAEAIKKLKALASDGRGFILALPHMGSWEMAASTVRLHNLPLFSIAADQRNPYTNQYINNLRQAGGAPLVLRGGGTMREVVRRLRGGEILAILPDLRQRTPGLVVPFLGGEANVADGLGAFARMAKVPVVPCFITRVGWTRHAFHVCKEIEPDPTIPKRQDIERITREVFAELDATIRANAEQWFWYNRRWVLDPLEEEKPPTAAGEEPSEPPS